jgi:hypothetical protein
VKGGILLLAGCLSGGCITIDVKESAPAEKKPSACAVKQQPAPCRMVVRWHNEVMHAPDPVHGGALAPVLVGRIYLFGQALATPLEGDGAVMVELFNLAEVVPPGTEGTPEGGPRRLERWIIDPVTLQKLRRKDMIGWGYNLALPWGTYRPDLTRLQMRVCYQPAKGSPVFETGTLVLGGTTVLEPPKVVNQSPSSGPALGSGTSPASLPKPTEPGLPAAAVSPSSTFSSASTLIAPGIRSWSPPVASK